MRAAPKKTSQTDPFNSPGAESERGARDRCIVRDEISSESPLRSPPAERAARQLTEYKFRAIARACAHARAKREKSIRARRSRRKLRPAGTAGSTT